jgi:hypothetical protein
MSLLAFSYNQFSQNGEDGILERIFSLIGIESKTCCEFGAWDGIHFSNTRRLLLSGWSGLLIEEDSARFKQLQANYQNCHYVRTLCRNVSERDDLGAILESVGLRCDLDLLVVDIDGLDYYVLEKLTCRPRVICIEVNAGHSPEAEALLPRDIAARNVGQPLCAFCRVASSLGYRLVAYNANAFFLREDVYDPELPIRTPSEAYQEYLAYLLPAERRWMYLVNRGLVPPFFRYRNPYLSAKHLRLGPVVASATLSMGCAKWAYYQMTSAAGVQIF